MESIYQSLGLRRAINASGRMTVLGVSAISGGVGEAMAAAAQNYVVMEELYARAGELISGYTGAQASCVTSCASAAIAMAAAGCVTKGKRSLVERVPDTAGLANEILLQKGHAVNFGASITQMLRIGGGVPVEAGLANKVRPDQLEEAITEKTAALFYVKSHHAVQKGMVPLPEMLEIAHAHGLPLIVDAAAEEDLQKYTALGADLVCYSGSKAIEGPTAGFVTGKRECVAWCEAQRYGIGRPMKVGKEGIVGLLRALGEYAGRDRAALARLQEREARALLDGLSGCPAYRASLIRDEAGREICRVRVQVLPGGPHSAPELSALLQAGDPAIYLRDYYADTGALDIDPRPLLPGDGEEIVRRLRALARQGKE